MNGKMNVFHFLKKNGKMMMRNAFHLCLVRCLSVIDCPGCRHCCCCVRCVRCLLCLHEKLCLPCLKSFCVLLCSCLQILVRLTIFLISVRVHGRFRFHYRHRLRIH